MSNSTTSWQEAVRLRCYQQTMAKSPESFDPQSRALNNLKLNKRSLTPTRDPGNSNDLDNLNILKAPGIPRAELFKDETLVKAIEWGFDEAMLQLCIGLYGKHSIKGIINKLNKLPEVYFKPQYGPVPQQRGRLLNCELKKLKQAFRNPY